MVMIMCNDIINYRILDVGFLNRNEIRINTKNKSCYALSCRIDGSAVFKTDNANYNVMKGDIIHIPKGANYSQYTEGEKIIFIHFDVFGNTTTEIQHISPRDKEYICDLFKKIYCLWNKKEKNYTYECTSILYQIIAKTSVTLPKENKNVISSAIKYINEYFYFSDFSLEKAYSLCNVSRSYFNRTFKQLMKTTPIDYINGLKINKAKLLLSSGAYTHSEIANLCGFADVKYFYVVFKKITGLTTREYKNDEQSTK